MRRRQISELSTKTLIFTTRLIKPDWITRYENIEVKTIDEKFLEHFGDKNKARAC